MAGKETTPVDRDDLLLAFEFVSGPESGDREAIISRETGRIYWLGADNPDVEPELPEDIDDPERYVSVPGKRDIDLGTPLVFRFAEIHMPETYNEIRRCFARRGAYARFKDLLERQHRLDQWYHHCGYPAGLKPLFAGHRPDGDGIVPVPGRAFEYGFCINGIPPASIVPPPDCVQVGDIRYCYLPERR